MKIRCTFFLLTTLVLGVRAQGVLRLANPSPVALTDAVVEIPWATVRAADPRVDTARLRIVRTDTNAEIPYQLEQQGTMAIQNLLVQVSVPARGSIRLSLQREKPTPVSPKAYGRYVPERFDDFAWENDRVAFRIYGAALNGHRDNAYGTDFWSKRTDRLIIDNWYKSGDYHKDHGEGLDYYQVGLTLGAGDLGVFLGDTLNFIHNYRTWEILDSGPLRFTFRVKFDAYRFGGVTVNTTKTISLDAGSQLSKFTVHLTHDAPKDVLPVVVGITLRREPGTLRLDEQAGILGYWEPRHGADGTVGIGCVFSNPIGRVPMRQEFGHGLAQFRAQSGQPLTYYSGGAWDKAGRIPSAEAWFEYLHDFATRLKNSVRVKAGK